MRILILGTSNSILKRGWVTGLREALPNDEIINKSIGGSPGTQFACMMQWNFEEYDLVFLDSVVNDENYLTEIGDEILLNRVMYEIASTIASKTKLIIVGFCNERYMEDSSSVYDSRKLLAQIIGAQFISIKDLMIHFGAAIMGADTRLFEVQYHPHQSLQFIFGAVIGQVIATTNTPAPQATESYEENFSSIHALDSSNIRRPWNYKNSIVQGRMNILGLGEKLKFVNNGICLGFYINARNTRAIVKMEGPRGSRLKELLFPLVADTIKIAFVPIRNGFHCESLTVVNDLGVIEKSLYSDLNAWPSPAYPLRLTIGDVAFWSGDRGAALPKPRAHADTDVIHREVHQKLARVYDAAALA